MADNIQKPQTTDIPVKSSPAKNTYPDKQIEVPKELSVKALEFDAIVLTITPPKVLIQWSFKEDLVKEDVVVRVLRSEAEAEQTLISPVIKGTDYPEFVDYSPILENLHKEIFYQVQVENTNTGKIINSEIKTWDGLMDLEAIYVIEENEFLLKDATGLPTFIFSHKNEGSRCPDCFDPIAGKRTTSSCDSCFGTGFLSGFYKPIKGYVDYSPDPKIKILEEWGEKQPTEVDMFMTSYPRVTPDDVVLQATTGKRYKVKRVQESEKRGVPMLQMARAELIPKGDIEYRVPVSESEIVDFAQEFNRLKSQRSF